MNHSGGKEHAHRRIGSFYCRCRRASFQQWFHYYRSRALHGRSFRPGFVARVNPVADCRARYANPLTLLPGNVPINEHIEHLLHTGTPFHVCYCDLDNFKPYNDVYSYRHGDEMITAGRTYSELGMRSKLDFIGHIGGDDFILLMQSRDFQARCEQALRSFETSCFIIIQT